MKDPVNIKVLKIHTPHKLNLELRVHQLKVAKLPCIFHKQLDKCTETDQLVWNLTSNHRMNGIHLYVEIYLENAINNF